MKSHLAALVLSLAAGILLGSALSTCSSPTTRPAPAPDPLATGQEAALRYAIWVLRLPVGPVLAPDGRLPE